MLRWDEAWFVAIVLVGVLILALILSELLAQVLQPVSDVLMGGMKDSTDAVVR